MPSRPRAGPRQGREQAIDAPTFGSLFAGIGGLDLGLERAGWRGRWQVERDAACRRRLERHWPDVRRGGDVRDHGSDLERVDLIVGGIPCQGISPAGNRLGAHDERWLWPEFYRILRLLRPRLALLENHPNLLAVNGGAAFGQILGDLAASRFHAEWDCVPASAVGAPHERDRLFVVAANADAFDGQTRLGIFVDDEASLFRTKDRNRASIWVAPPCVPARVGHGAACWMDRRERTELVGNAVVPQVAEWIGRRLMDVWASARGTGEGT